MKNDSLLVMVAGASSRMKKSLENADLSSTALAIAKHQHKSLIPLGNSQKPMLYFLLDNAMRAGIAHVYLITSEANGAFKDFVKKFQTDFQSMTFHFSVQKIPERRIKPLGTADAIEQCLEQHPELMNERFTVCNGDNLYSAKAFGDLRKERVCDHALIAYDRDGLKFPDGKIARFALMQLSSMGFLADIVEKPDLNDLTSYQDVEGRLRVSMNIYSFFGKTLYPFLKECPLHPERKEKELPEAVKNMARSNQNAVLGIPRSEHVPDITNAHDVKDFYL